MKKESPLYLAIFLAIVSAIAGGALAFANQMTAPVIQRNADNAKKEALLEMYPDAHIDEFTAVNLEDITDLNPEVDSVYTYGSDYVIFQCTVPGFDGGTTFLVSINKVDGTIDHFKAISNGDTKGYGSKIMDPPFAESLKGKDAGGELDTISGATKTSTPVVEAINRCAVIAPTIE